MTTLALAAVSIVAAGIAGAEAPSTANGLRGASALVVSPDGAHVYVTGTTDDGLVALRRDAATGKLTFVQSLLDGLQVEGGLAAPTSLALSPDGTVLAVSGRLDRLLLLQRDPATGTLTAGFTDTERNRLRTTDVAISDDGAFLYYTATERGERMLQVHVARLDGADEPTPVQTVAIQSTSPVARTAVALSPDGRRLYLRVSPFGLWTFPRDPETGMLDSDGSLSVGFSDGRTTAFSVSPDGRHVYAPVAHDDGDFSVWVFEPTPGGFGAGDPSLVEDPGLSRPRVTAMTASADGAHVYLAVARTDALVVYQRDAATGALALVETHDEDSHAGLGLQDASAIALSPDGRHLYLASTRGAVSTFERNQESGALHFVETVFDDVGCSPEPRTDCRPAKGKGRGSLRVDYAPGDEPDVFSWSWGGKGTTAAEDFGNPAGTRNRYTLCFYDGTESWPQPIALDTECPECWRRSGSSRLQLRRKPADWDVRERLTLSSMGPRARIAYRLRGDGIETPFLPIVLPLVVQLQTESGTCFEARYTASRRNDDGAFLAHAVAARR